MKSLFTMVGMQYRHSKEIVAAMKAGTPLTLKRDPFNPADPNAVEVWYGDRHIAFIKGTQVRALALKMDAAGQKSIPGIFAVSADRWPQVEVDSR
jgi:hypothetical protein